MGAFHDLSPPQPCVQPGRLLPTPGCSSPWRWGALSGGGWEDLSWRLLEWALYLQTEVLCVCEMPHLSHTSVPVGVTKMAGGGEGLTGKRVSSSGERWGWGAGSRGSGRGGGARKGRLAHMGVLSQGLWNSAGPEACRTAPVRPAGSWGS